MTIDRTRTISIAALAGGLSAVALAAAADPLPARSDLTAADRDRIYAITAPTADFTAAENFEANPGGGTTTRRFDRDAFSQPAENLDFAGRADFSVGNGVFRKLWVSAPSSTTASDGLGPLFNARGCQECHIKDGRGHPPQPGATDAISFLLGLSPPPAPGAPPSLSLPSMGGEDHPTPAEPDAAPAASPAQPVPVLGDEPAPRAGANPSPLEGEVREGGTPAAEPAFAFGNQLQDFAVPGVPAEGRVAVTYTEIPIALAGGETAWLRDPTYTVEAGGFGALPEGTLISPRIAPQMIGLGLLEAIHPDDIIAGADPDDANGDGISGRVHWVTDALTGATMIGRFGWKATQPSIAQQSAHAFLSDMGLSTAMLLTGHGDCSPLQTACMDAPIGADEAALEPEVAPELFDVVVFYAGHLAVPGRRDYADPDVLAGKALFYEAGCTGCHTPKYVTSNEPDIDAALRRQLIWPYTDLLLHDMGAGLADNRPQDDATGTEWRTPPLWGIGLTGMVNGDTAGFLHDGRARTLLEAVLWHGGESEAARDAVAAMTPEERALLIRFLESL